MESIKKYRISRHQFIREPVNAQTITYDNKCFLTVNNVYHNKQIPYNYVSFTAFIQEKKNAGSQS